MNKYSLSYDHVQNQQASSWIDDPFNLKGKFDGMDNVSNNQDISNHAEQLVFNYAKYECSQYELSLQDLPEYEQNELVRLYLESTGRETNECVHGNDFSINNDYTCALLEMLQNDCRETREHFAEITRKNIVTYYSKSLQEIIDDACSSYLNNMMNEQGLYGSYDIEQGDITWRQF